ncbi:MAG TPA: BMP family ABC transporter substrate-binding protein [Polyangiales bacterium]|nr:BMP family ABC transporter substrate-binding protein [Polyangiales bacterium]
MQAFRLFDWSDTYMLATTSLRIAVRPTRLTAAISGALLLASACSKSAPKPAEEAPAPTGEAKPAAPADKTLKIGFIYVGPRDDFGYNQAHSEAAKVLSAMPDIKIFEEEKVPETMDVQRTMESMINLDGATVLFPTSYGYFDPHILKVAAKYPNVTFLHCGGLYDPAKHPKNVGSYFGYIDEAEYLNGIVAGYATKSKKLGFIAAKPIPQVLRNINAFTLGARSVHPDITTTVVFTGDWSLPVKEADASNSLIDQGVDVLTMHVDSPKVIVQTAEKRGIYSVGYHTSQAALAPKGYLTGAEWNWSTVYENYIKQMRAGAPLQHLVRGGLKDGFVKSSPYGAAVTPEAKTAAEAVRAKMMDGSFVIFKGELKDNKGAVIVPAGTELKQTDPVLETMNYLVTGVVGSTGSGS